MINFLFKFRRYLFYMRLAKQNNLNFDYFLLPFFILSFPHFLIFTFSFGRAPSQAQGRAVRS